MKILPVIDLLGGKVVRGVGGRRSEYRPIESVLCDDPQPGSVAQAFRDKLGFDTCYVADLDAIAGAEPSTQCYDAIIEAGLQPWIDAGTGTVERAAAIARYLDAHAPHGRIVVGLESLVDMATLARIVDLIGPDRAVFSLDLREGKPVTNDSRLQAQSPMAIAKRAIEIGIQTLIVLDIASVGMSTGVPTLNLCRDLCKSHPSLKAVTGGGIRSVSDLNELAKIGCSSVLVSSALHDGRLIARGTSMSKCFDEQPFVFAEKAPRDPNEILAGSCWSVRLIADKYLLEYLSGEVAGRAKEIEIAESDFLQLQSGATGPDEICIRYGVY